MYFSLFIETFIYLFIFLIVFKNNTYLFIAFLF